MHEQISKKTFIAIVDDEDDIVKLFRDALGSINGITDFTFTDPVMALEHFKMNVEKYTLVISDLENACSYRNGIDKGVENNESICKNNTIDSICDRRRFISRLC